MKIDDAINIIEEAIEVIKKEAYWFHASELEKVIKLLKEQQKRIEVLESLREMET